MFQTFQLIDALDRTEKKTAITCIAVRDTGVSRYHDGPIENLPETPVNSTALSF